MPPDSPKFGSIRHAKISPVCTFKISHYAVDYRYLVAYKINAQGWKKRLVLDISHLGLGPLYIVNAGTLKLEFMF